MLSYRKYYNWCRETWLLFTQSSKVCQEPIFICLPNHLNINVCVFLNRMLNNITSIRSWYKCKYFRVDSVCDCVIVLPLMFVQKVRMREKSFVFRNTFVCTDRVLVANCYHEVLRDYLVTTQYFVSLLKEARKLQFMIQKLLIN